jgi:hypothetical protein
MLKKVLRKLKQSIVGGDPELPSTAEIPGHLKKLINESGQRSSFSVVIPTMWKRPDITARLIRQIAAADCVDEIIIIGNAPTPSPLRCEKARILQQDSNIYVNPAWNLGVQHSKNENLIIINDDLLISSNMLGFMSTVDLSKIGMIGIGQSSLSEIDDDLDFDSPQSLKLSTRMNYGYGTCMFIHKSNYHEIPPAMKIYFGDSFLYDTHRLRGTPNMTLETAIKTEMSATSGLPVFSKLKEADAKAWDDIYKEIEESASTFNR